ncbi:rhamnogalacturonan acetylesterase [Paenibacillus bovis]|uniref:GDSL family lipase n=1 Tax=Paenibacillus bovis TaxID=1616788 RepID=A0A172ZE37_9BACL|nr:rhamnogalacturonan acetylesterase [Paenibacillus bovis]ANF95527.1 GDSL family lipase [Paenibacillus bovis]
MQAKEDTTADPIVTPVVPQEWHFDIGPGEPAAGCIGISPDSLYTPEYGYGFLPGGEVYGRDRSGMLDSGQAELVSHVQTSFCILLGAVFALDVPDGYYQVKLTVGDLLAATHTVIRFDSSRLLLPPIYTQAGQLIEMLCTVAVRSGQLRLSFGGRAPRLNHLQITAVPDTLKLVLAGDSTVTDQPADGYPYAGWGQLLPARFRHDVCVDNHAVSGRSSMSFIQEGRLDRIREVLHAGDFLFIQFGHNDEKTDAARHTDPFTTYKQYLTEYINAARDKQAIPVLLTPVSRRSFDNEGRLADTHGDYLIAMRELADEQQVPLIDLAERTRELLEQLGPEASKELFVWLHPGEYMNFPAGSQDNTHFQEYGANRVADLVIQGIRELNLQPLTMYLR